MQVGQQYDTLLDQFKTQKAALKKPSADATPVEKAEYKDAQAQVAALNAQLKEIVPEYRRTKTLREQELEKQRVSGMSPEDYMLEQMGQQEEGMRATGRTENKGQLFAAEAPAVVPEDTSLQDYVAAQMTAAQNAGALSAQDRLDYLMYDPEMARQVVDNRVPVPGMDRKEQKMLYDNMQLYINQFDEQRAEQEKQQAEQADRMRGLMAGTTPGADVMGAARQAPAVQAAEQQRSVDEARARVVTPEVESLRKLGQTPEYSRAEALRQSYEANKAAEQANDALAQKVVDTLPINGPTITPGKVYEGLGGGTMLDRSDLLTQLAVARETKNNGAARTIIENLRGLGGAETKGTGEITTAAEQASLGRSTLPEARAKEAAADKYGQQQNEIGRAHV
jgi:hypothetical protein